MEWPHSVSLRIWVSVLQSKGKILHVFGWDKKFVPPFIDFVRDHFDDSEHCFIIYGPVNDGSLQAGANVIHYPSLLKNLPTLLAQLRSSRKVILHGLFSSHLVYALALQPRALKKCYWTIWGGDLYVHNAKVKDWRWLKNEWFRRFVVCRLGHFITHIEGDYRMAQQWYGAKGEWHECFMYPSNLYQEASKQSLPHEGINILLGNSADPSNNHIEVLDNLKCHAGENIRIYCPLSYGDQSHAQRVSDYGGSLFGDKFITLREFMPPEKYNDLLAEIDVAIFNHKRQQGMGNIVGLLGRGKKVYLRNDITTWKTLNDIGLLIGDINNIQLTLLDEKLAKQNKEKISIYFSRQNLIKCLDKLFSSY